MPRDPTDWFSLLQSRRKYASFFEFGEKWQKELSVGEELVRALNMQLGYSLSELALQEPDPPDLTCLNGTDRVAIEVTELVCQRAVRANQKGNAVYREWRPGQVAVEIQALLRRKDAAELKGGPYDSFWLCIFTDEFTLSSSRIAEELQAVTFSPLRQIAKAFLLFSYEPGKPNYPVLPLKLGA